MSSREQGETAEAGSLGVLISVPPSSAFPVKWPVEGFRYLPPDPNTRLDSLLSGLVLGLGDQDMADFEGSAVAPLYRLDASSWACLASFLDSGSVFRLSAMSGRLSSLLRSAIQDLELEWISSRFLDLSTVLSAVRSYSHVYRLVFRQPKSTIRCWTPIDWQLLPPTLTSLTMSFLGAPSLLLVPGLLKSTLPGLLHLEVEDARPSYAAVERTTASKISFLDAPPCLLTLRVKSRLPLLLIANELSSLPSCLETLDLDFKALFEEEKENVAATIPSLPRSLKYLKITDKSTHYWEVRLADLPASLETLEIESENSWPRLITSDNAQDFASDICTLVYIEGAATHLVNLKRLIAPNLTVGPEQVFSLLPRSLTEIDLVIDLSYETPNEVLEYLGPRLLSVVEPRWDGMIDDLIRDRSFTLSRLKRVVTHEYYRAEVFLPDSITDLAMDSCSKHDRLPQSIRKLKFDFGIQPDVEVLWNPSHLLETLSVTQGSIPTHLIETLPNTLRKMEISMDDKAFGFLLEFASRASNLPNLTTLKNNKSTSLDSIQHVPTQLRKLRISAAHNSLLGQGMPEALSASNIEYLSITMLPRPRTASHSDREAEFTALLNTLPTKLKGLELFSDHPLSLYPPVKLPSSLTSLHGSTTRPRGNLSVEGRLELPDSLTRLTLHPACPFPIECLPPNLSLYEANDTGDEKEYLKSRVPPTPEQELIAL